MNYSVIDSQGKPVDERNIVIDRNRLVITVIGDNLKLGFNGYNGWTFKIGNNCKIRHGVDCTLNCGNNCEVVHGIGMVEGKIGKGCTFKELAYDFDYIKKNLHGLISYARLHSVHESKDIIVRDVDHYTKIVSMIVDSGVVEKGDWGFTNLVCTELHRTGKPVVTTILFNKEANVSNVFELEEKILQL